MRIYYSQNYNTYITILLKFYYMAVHIGKIIKHLVKSKGISVTNFADKINYSRRNVYEIFDKETIDTGLLIKISKILDYNLFLNYITEAEIIVIKTKNTKSEELMSIILDIKKSVDTIKSKSKK